MLSVKTPSQRFGKRVRMSKQIIFAAYYTPPVGLASSYRAEVALKRAFWAQRGYARQPTESLDGLGEEPSWHRSGLSVHRRPRSAEPAMHSTRRSSTSQGV